MTRPTGGIGRVLMVTGLLLAGASSAVQAGNILISEVRDSSLSSINALTAVTEAKVEVAFAEIREVTERRSGVSLKLNNEFEAKSAGRFGKLRCRWFLETPRLSDPTETHMRGYTLVRDGQTLRYRDHDRSDEHLYSADELTTPVGSRLAMLEDRCGDVLFPYGSLKRAWGSDRLEMTALEEEESVRLVFEPKNVESLSPRSLGRRSFKLEPAVGYLPAEVELFNAGGEKTHHLQFGDFREIADGVFLPRESVREDFCGGELVRRVRYTVLTANPVEQFEESTFNVLATLDGGAKRIVDHRMDPPAVFEP